MRPACGKHLAEDVLAADDHDLVDAGRSPRPARAISSPSSRLWATTAPGRDEAAIARQDDVERGRRGRAASDLKVRRPMMIGLAEGHFAEIAHDRCESRQGRSPPLPMAPFSPMATTSAMMGAPAAALHDSHRHLGVDRRVRVVAHELEVLIGEIEQRA